MAKLSWLAIFSLLSFSIPRPTHAICTPPGAVFSVPTITTGTSGISQLKENLTSVIAQFLTSGPTYDALLLNETSFSVAITSVNETLFEAHHTAQHLGDYVDSPATNVTSETSYRVASITKVFIVLGLLLQSGVSLNDPITKYVPELTEGNNTGGVRWEDITLGALGSQLSGIAMYYGSDLLGFIDAATAKEVGLPQVDPNVPPCGKNATDVVCTREQFLRGFKEHPPIFYPSDQASYSNTAFVLLGFVIEKITGKNYEDVLKDEIFAPLDMTSSSFTKPEDSKGIIPYITNIWTWDFGPMNAEGGLYSTTSDLLKFVRGILTHKLLPQAKTNAWLKPASYSGSLSTTYGMPWEIYRSKTITPDGRVVTLYTKNGGVPGYNSYFVLSPEYNIGATILVAGNAAVSTVLLDGFAEYVIPAVDAIARKETRTMYAGSYSDAASNSSLTLTVDEDGPGIHVQEIIVRGVDFLSIIGVLYQSASGLVEMRLYPTGLNSDAKFPWRFAVTPQSSTESSPFGEVCLGNWDSLPWGAQPLNEFVFEMEDGKVSGVELTGLRLALTRE